MATKQRKAKFNTKPLVFIGALAILISLAVLGLQLTNNVSDLLGISLTGTVINAQGVETEQWWHDNWKYRVPVRILETVGLEHKGYIIEVELNTFDLIGEGKLKGDCSDLRVVESGQVILHDIGTRLSANDPITQGCNKGDTIVRVRPDVIPKNFNNSLFQIYYGNPEAVNLADSVSYWQNRRYHLKYRN